MPDLSATFALPNELIDKIILEAWILPLTTEDRITLMTASTLVNKTWSHMFACISFKDVHIPCPSYLPSYFGIIRKTNFYSKTQSPEELACRSIHLTVENTPIHPRASPIESIRSPIERTAADMPMGRILAQLVWTLGTSPGGFPNLRTLSVDFINMDFDDIFANHRFFQFPHQVTDLELRFSFSPQTPPWLLHALRTNQARRSHRVHTYLPSVRRLMVLGGSEAFVADVVQTCKGLETLEVDFPVEFGPGRRKSHLVSLRVNGETQPGTNLYKTELIIAGPSRKKTFDLWEGVLVDAVSGVHRFARRS
jgi:hypothetical protein